jgi:hypothetical protein
MNDAVREAIERNIEGIDGSVAFVSLYSDGMADFRKDPIPSIQLAIAILLDKPIILALLSGRTPPSKLLKIADAVVYGGDPQALAAGIRDAMLALDVLNPDEGIDAVTRDTL